MFSSTKKKVTAVVVLVMMLMAVGSVAAMAAPDKVTMCHIPPGNPENAHTIEVGPAAVPAHLAHGDYAGECKGEDGEDPDDPGDDPEDGDGDECETVSIDIGIEVDICLLVDVDADELLEVLGFLHGESVHDILKWLHGDLLFGDHIDRLRDKIDLHHVFRKLGGLKHEAVPGLIGFVGGSVFNLLDPATGGGSGGGGNCFGGINVCNNANDALDLFGGGGYGGGNDCAGGINVCNNANDALDLFGGGGYGGGDDCGGGINVCNNANGLVDSYYGLYDLGDVFSLAGHL